MAAGDSAAWPLLASVDVRATLPEDKRASIEAAYVALGPTRWCPPPPGVSTRIVAVTMLLLASALAVMIYQALERGVI